MTRLTNILRTLASWRTLLMGVVAVALLLAPLAAHLAGEASTASPIAAEMDQSDPSDAPIKAVVHCGHCLHHQATRVEPPLMPTRSITLASQVHVWNDARPDSASPSPLPKPPRA